MTDRIIRSPYPEEEPGEPRPAHEDEDEPCEPEPFDDDSDDGEAVPLP